MLDIRIAARYALPMPLLRATYPLTETTVQRPWQSLVLWYKGHYQSNSTNRCDKKINPNTAKLDKSHWLTTIILRKQSGLTNAIALKPTEFTRLELLYASHNVKSYARLRLTAK